MNDDFDPYLQWLGIGPGERPVDHYRLLGVSRFESDPKLIGAAADERMTFVRTFQTGPRGAHTQQLLNDFASARVCLLNPRTKATYDDFLRGLAAVTPGGSPLLPSTGFESAVLPPNVGTQLPAAAPLATPVAYHPQGGYSGQAPMAIPMAMPVGYPPHAYAASNTPPISYSPAPPLAAPPRPEPSLSPPPPTSTSRPPAPSVAAEPTSSLADSDEPAESIMTRRWFPVVVIAAVVLVAAVVWGVGHYFNPPAVTQVEPEPDPMDEATADENPEQGTEKKSETKKSKHDYPSEVFLAQEGNGQINFPASVAKLIGPTLTLHVEGPDPVITGWTGDDDAVSWDFRVVRPDIFRVEITYAAETAGGQFMVTVGESEKSGEVVSTGSAGTFRTDKVFLPVKRKGKHVLTVRTVQRNGEQLWVLKSIRFVPQGVTGK